MWAAAVVHAGVQAEASTSATGAGCALMLCRIMAPDIESKERAGIEQEGRVRLH
jgi:hypothetical protein